MRFDVLTLFPRMFDGPLGESMIGRAQSKGLIQIVTHNIRDFTDDKHNTADDYPFGGGSGMVMKPEPVALAIEHAISLAKESCANNPRVILTSPAGKPLTQEMVKDFASCEHLIILCGHYEGIDERVTTMITDEVSIGDYVLTGGELPAMVIIDATSRLIDGVLGDEESAVCDSFFNTLLDYPHYTRPQEWRGISVPQVLVSGDHKKIEHFRRKESLRRTYLRRPDLLETIELSPEDAKMLDDIKSESEL